MFREESFKNIHHLTQESVGSSSSSDLKCEELSVHDRNRNSVTLRHLP